MAILECTYKTGKVHLLLIIAHAEILWKQKIHFTDTDLPIQQAGCQVQS